MGIYHTIYYNLCETRKSMIDQWIPGSGIHKHHIVPKHSGGSNDIENITYLTVREHIIAHFLLWKINNNPNDLRSMNMLGARLTTNQRREIGLWCHRNKIGIFSPNYTKECRIQTAKKSTATMMSRRVGIHDPSKKSEYSRISAAAMIKSGNNHIWAFWCSPEGQQIRASRGGKAMTGYKWMNKEDKFVKVMPDKIQEHLDNGYVFGSRKTGGTVKRGSRSMYNSKIDIYRLVHPDKIQEHLDSGWDFRSPIKLVKGSKYMYKMGDSKSQIVKESDIPTRIEEGYIFGRKKS